MDELGFVKQVEALESADGLDAPARVLTAVVNAVLPQTMRDVLHGVPLGHPLHPAEAMIPLGAWTSAAALDLLPGARRAATALVLLGTVSAVPTALSGITDWSMLTREQQRVGLVHWMGNAAAVGLYSMSLVNRLRGRHLRGVVLGMLGLGVASGAGYLGGHLAYRQGAGVR